MSTRFVLFSIVTTLLFVVTFAEAEKSEPAEVLKSYGEVVQFQPGKSLHFPDFVLIYNGRKIRESKPLKGLNTYDFTILTKDGKEQKVNWGSTGMIFPVAFHIDSATFDLELKHSAVANRDLEENELVISAQ